MEEEAITLYRRIIPEHIAQYLDQNVTLVGKLLNGDQELDLGKGNSQNLLETIKVEDYQADYPFEDEEFRWVEIRGQIAANGAIKCHSSNPFGGKTFSKQFLIRIERVF